MLRGHTLRAPIWPLVVSVGWVVTRAAGADLAAIRRPLLVIASDADETFIAAQYEPTITVHTGTGSYTVLPGVTHIGLLTDEAARAARCSWLEAFNAKHRP